MTSGKEKKFVIKHAFSSLRDLKRNGEARGNKEYHFGVPWCLTVLKLSQYCYINIECLKFHGADAWSIDTSIEVKMLAISGEEVFVKNLTFTNKNSIEGDLKFQAHLETYLVDGNLTIECHVTIKTMEGIRFDKLRYFSEETMKKLSDVVLVVEDQKFHVYKMYLAAHSSYFESLFLGNFDESKQSEVELKDIDSWDFQKFLEVLYGEPAIDEDNVDGILKLADMYDAKTAIKRCEEFFMYKSKQELKVKFTAAVKYNMDKLKKICISGMKTANDINSVLPQHPNDMEPVVWEELLKLCISFCNKK